jgi:hypothetical protein
MPVEKGCGQVPAKAFSPARETGAARLSTGALHPCAGTAKACGSPRKGTPAKIHAGYHSPVCSSEGDPIDRITAAIDQLASDARDDAEGPGIAARVAQLWQMLGEIDPELARRTRRYTAADGGTPVE